MKQLLYTYSSFYKPTLTKLDFSSSKTRKYFLYPIDIIERSIKKTLIKKITLSLIIFLFFTISCVAQQKISGVVIAANGSPLSGATISIKGSKIATATTTDGSFIITAKARDILLISYVGYNTKQIIIANESID